MFDKEFDISSVMNVTSVCKTCTMMTPIMNTGYVNHISINIETFSSAAFNHVISATLLILIVFITVVTLKNPGS